jgi:hypothetical protein
MLSKTVAECPECGGMGSSPNIAGDPDRCPECWGFGFLPVKMCAGCYFPTVLPWWPTGTGIEAAHGLGGGHGGACEAVFIWERFRWVLKAEGPA